MILEEEYTEGVLNGKVTSYFNNGEKLQVEEYVLGDKQGVSEKFYLSGELEISYEYLKNIHEECLRGFGVSFKYFRLF